MPRILAKLAKFVLFCAAAALLVGAFTVAARPWYQRWGATDAEIVQELPGDELMPAADSVATRSITIQAPAAHIYPWLVQMGQNRGGLYSYEWLENLVGSDIHNADEIVPEWQTVQEGDRVTIGPWPSLPYYTVELMQSPQALVWQSHRPATGEAGGTWQFYLHERDDGTTRLIIRHRDPGSAGAVDAAINAVFEPISFIMEMEMMRGIRARAEAASMAGVLLDQQ